MLSTQGKLRHGSGDGYGTSLGGGDSGGPAIVNNQVLGVASNIGSIGNNQLLSNYASLTSSNAQSFLSQARSKGFDLGNGSVNPDFGNGPGSVNPGPGPGVNPGNGSFTVSWDLGEFVSASGRSPSGATKIVISGNSQGGWLELAETAVSGGSYRFQRFYAPKYMNQLQISAVDRSGRTIDSKTTYR